LIIESNIKICNVKSDENVWRCMDMFKRNNVDTMLMKRMQKFLDVYEHTEQFIVPNNYIV